MAAGYTYKLTPAESVEEFYAVRTGERRIGAFLLDTTNLAVGTIVPPFAPLYCDLVNKKATVVLNAKVYADAASGDTEVKVPKGTVAYAGELLSDGTNTITVSSIDTSNSAYDVLTVEALSADLAAGTVLFNVEEGKTEQSVVANSALYGKHVVTTGNNLVAALRRAAEIEPTKLIIPFSSADRAKLGERFEFNDNE